MRKGLRAGFLGALAAVAVAGGASAEPSPAVPVEDWSVRGLDAPAEIVIDHWGTPHNFAASARDAFFLQGYNAARDRLWQIDLWRKRGLGRLAASFGPAYAEQDRAARLFLYRGDMKAEWAAYAPDAREIVEAFVAGVNAYVEEVRAGTKPLPVEFGLTRSRPERWNAEDVLRIRSHTLVVNATSELARARVACAAGIDADRLRRSLAPEHEIVVPDGLDPCDIPADALADYTLATQPVSFDALVEPDRAAGVPSMRLAADASIAEGSNNWVIAPSRTATGRPILANDPHRAYAVPSLRYIVGLHAPGLALVGAGEPALPGVSFGHNERIAFGLTIFPIDQEDLYVYTLKPGDPRSYRYGEGWERMRVVRETIEVKGERSKRVELLFTRHGPVLKLDEEAGRAFAVRSVWTEPGVAGYFGSSRLFRAGNWEEFKAASNAWGAPPLNLVYADIEGNIGWAASGLTPIRRNWDGLLPAPGDGRYEWDGFLADDLLPSLVNPPEGFFGTANEMNLPAGYPADERNVAWEWADTSRIDRIREVLGAETKATIAGSAALQADSVNVLSRRAIALLKTLKSDDADIAAALAVLNAWDNDEEVSSAAAAIYQVWTAKHLGAATVAKAAPAAAHELIGQGQLDAVLAFLETPEAPPGADPAALRDRILLESLAAAVRELKERLGPDMATWSWGRLHRISFDSALAALADPELRAQMQTGPLQIPGSGSSPRAGAYRRSDFAVTLGASVRMALDVGAWDNSVAINAPGQSGDPFDAHYRDLLPIWAEGKQVPLAFTREAVDRNAGTLIRLTPAR